jgi:uncharacterized membrane protein YecN with MAPEG domain
VRLVEGLSQSSLRARGRWSNLFLALNCLVALHLGVDAVFIANYYRVLTKNSETPYLASIFMLAVLGTPAILAAICALVHYRMGGRRWLVQWTLGAVPLVFEVLRFTSEMLVRE